MLTISDMRGRARAFVNEWEGETHEAAERQTFWNEWFEIFGIRRPDVDTLSYRPVRFCQLDAR